MTSTDLEVLERTGEWCMFFIFKTYSSPPKRCEKIDISFKGPKKMTADSWVKREFWWPKVADSWDLAESPHDRDHSWEVAFGSTKRVVL